MDSVFVINGHVLLYNIERSFTNFVKVLSIHISVSYLSKFQLKLVIASLKLKMLFSLRIRDFLIIIILSLLDAILKFIKIGKWSIMSE